MIPEEIDEEIVGMEEEDNNFNFDLEISLQNKSVQYDQSRVIFKKHQILVNKFGAQQPNLAKTQVEMNPDCFKEIRKIGKGTAGEVWLADYNENGQSFQVAIKQIPVGDKQGRDQFIKDIKAFVNSDCPHIVKYYGSFYREGILNEVIEYMDIGSLRDIINFTIKMNKGGLLEPILAEMSFRILSGLQYLHKRKQIHRDIKPQNILVNKKGEVKITDFGIFKQLDKTYELSKTAVGTQCYMSPQRVNNCEYNFNCDVWSFGLILYQLATGKDLPYKKDNAKESEWVVGSKIRSLPPPFVSPQEGRSPEFCHFLSRCVQKDEKVRGNVEQLLKHPWLNKNRDEGMLKEYLRMLVVYQKSQNKE